jgi:hypothetical protein
MSSELLPQALASAAVPMPSEPKKRAIGSLDTGVTSTRYLHLIAGRAPTFRSIATRRHGHARCQGGLCACIPSVGRGPRVDYLMSSSFRSLGFKVPAPGEGVAACGVGCLTGGATRRFAVADAVTGLASSTRPAPTDAGGEALVAATLARLDSANDDMPTVGARSGGTTCSVCAGGRRVAKKEATKTPATTTITGPTTASVCLLFPRKMRNVEESWVAAPPPAAGASD